MDLALIIAASIPILIGVAKALIALSAVAFELYKLIKVVT